MTGIVGDWLDASTRVFYIGLAAAVFIIVAKLLAARYERFMPQSVRDLIAII